MDMRYGAVVRRALQSSTDVFNGTRAHFNARLHPAGHADRRRTSITSKLQCAVHVDITERKVKQSG